MPRPTTFAPTRPARRRKKSSRRKLTGSPKRSAGKPFAAGRARPGSGSIGWATAEVFQLVCLGPELYNGVSGIALFLAAHAQVTGSALSRELALAGLARLRKTLRGRNAPRLARSLGIGGAAGLGSIVYALTVISKSLRDDALLADAHAAAEQFTDDLIAADQRLDVIGGSAGAILGLLRLHRDTGSAEVLGRALKCGEHLLAQSRIGPEGRRSWVGQGFGPHPLNGMSHGAAGFAYALASLAAATGREDFAAAAAECIAFEDSSYDPARHNWPDLRWGGEPTWPCQWCHGAPGIGLARLATAKRGSVDARLLTTTRATPSRASSTAGAASSIRSVADRSAASNFSARPAMPLPAATCANSRRSGCSPSCERPRQGAITVGTAAKAGSISACFADLRASAIPLCAGSTARCRTS